MRRFISASCRGRWSDSPAKDLPTKAPTTDTIRASVCPNVALVTADLDNPDEACPISSG